MKFSLFLMAFAVLTAFPLTAKAFDNTTPPALKAEATKQMAEKAVPIIKAVAFHSDSCGSCKIIGPRIVEAMTIINADKVEMVKLDFTNKGTIEETKSLAAQKNVGNVLQKYGAKTGFIVLVNNEGKVVDKIKVDHDTAEMAAKLATAVAEAS